MIVDAFGRIIYALQGPPKIYGAWAYPVHCVIEFLGSVWFLYPVGGLLVLLLCRKQVRLKQIQSLIVFYYFLSVAKITGLIVSSSFIPNCLHFETETFIDTTRINIGLHMSQVNLELFSSIAGTFRHNILYGLVQMFGNIILFIPCGMFIQNFSKKSNLFLSVFYCFLVSLLIETCQLFLPSSFDVDDLLLNTMGGAIGVLVLQIPVLKRRVVRIQHRVQEKIR